MRSALLLALLALAAGCSRVEAEEELDATWLPRVLVAAGYWQAEEIRTVRAPGHAVTTGGTPNLSVWITRGSESDTDGVVHREGVRSWWTAQGYRVWVEPVGPHVLDERVVARVVTASLGVEPRDGHGPATP